MKGAASDAAPGSVSSSWSACKRDPPVSGRLRSAHDRTIRARATTMSFVPRPSIERSVNRWRSIYPPSLGLLKPGAIFAPSHKQFASGEFRQPGTTRRKTGRSLRLVAAGRVGAVQHAQQRFPLRLLRLVGQALELPKPLMRKWSSGPGTRADTCGCRRDRRDGNVPPAGRTLRAPRGRPIPLPRRGCARCPAPAQYPGRSSLLRPSDRRTRMIRHVRAG